jgi:hypothetical protein
MNSINNIPIDNMEKISSISRVVEVFEVNFKRSPTIKIKILEDNNGLYYGISNHFFWGPEQGDCYRASGPKDSIENALNSSIQGLIEFDKKDYPDDVVCYVYESEDSREKIYIDGCGEEVSYKEIISRREKYRFKSA